MAERIVVKVGSNVLTLPDGTLDLDRMRSLAGQIARLRESGREVILVSSGAVAGGRSKVTPRVKLDSVQQRQLYSAVGQVMLMHHYCTIFAGLGITVGQVLTMKESFSTRREYLNQMDCMQVMLTNDVLPIVNENDTVSLTELMFTDNDELSGLVASMMGASTLVILSNVDGIYNGDPSEAGTSVIRSISPHDDLSSYIRTGKSSFGRGGMLTKCTIARRVASEGIRVMVANGKRDNILTDLLVDNAGTVHTEFEPAASMSGLKKWVANSSSFSKGTVTIDDRAVAALKSNAATSLLLVGVTSVDGDFEEGDIIRICDSNGEEVAFGRSSFSCAEVGKLKGQRDIRPLVHYDYLFVI